MVGMPQLPPSSKYLQQADEPIDEIERESLSKKLSDAYADGNMEQHEYMASLDVVYKAETLGELVPVVEHLPATADPVPKGVEVRSSVPAGEVNRSRNVVAPALIVTGTVLTLLVILGVLIFGFIL